MLTTKEEFIKYLNDLKIWQSSIDWVEDMPEDNEMIIKLIESEVVKDKIMIDRHRWYETCFCICKIKVGLPPFDQDWLIAVKYVNNVYSENMGVEDCDHMLSFHDVDVEVIKTINYKIHK